MFNMGHDITNVFWIFWFYEGTGFWSCNTIFDGDGAGWCHCSLFLGCRYILAETYGWCGDLVTVGLIAGVYAPMVYACLLNSY